MFRLWQKKPFDRTCLFALCLVVRRSTTIAYFRHSFFPEDCTAKSFPSFANRHPFVRFDSARSGGGERITRDTFDRRKERTERRANKRQVRKTACKCDVKVRAPGTSPSFWQTNFQRWPLVRNFMIRFGRISWIMNGQHRWRAMIANEINGRIKEREWITGRWHFDYWIVSWVIKFFF